LQECKNHYDNEAKSREYRFWLFKLMAGKSDIGADEFDGKF
jgi:hypothetical protein